MDGLKYSEILTSYPLEQKPLDEKISETNKNAEITGNEAENLQETAVNPKSVTENLLTDHLENIKRIKSSEQIESKESETVVANSNDPISYIESAFNQSMSVGSEGVLIKNFESPYIPNKRSNDWLKLKKDYLSMADTLDLIVMGAYYGKGKRTGVFGGFLMGCRTVTSSYESLCKLGTGFDDKSLLDLKKLETSQTKPSAYMSSVDPDVWIVPGIVFEVNAAEISSSSLYTTGLSLRFPRFILLI